MSNDHYNPKKYISATDRRLIAEIIAPGARQGASLHGTPPRSAKCGIDSELMYQTLCFEHLLLALRRIDHLPAGAEWLILMQASQSLMAWAAGARSGNMANSWLLVIGDASYFTFTGSERYRPLDATPVYEHMRRHAELITIDVGALIGWAPAEQGSLDDADSSHSEDPPGEVARS